VMLRSTIRRGNIRGWCSSISIRSLSPPSWVEVRNLKFHRPHPLAHRRSAVGRRAVELPPLAAATLAAHAAPLLSTAFGTFCDSAFIPRPRASCRHGRSQRRGMGPLRTGESQARMAASGSSTASPTDSRPGWAVLADPATRHHQERLPSVCATGAGRVHLGSSCWATTEDHGFTVPLAELALLAGDVAEEVSSIPVAHRF